MSHNKTILITRPNHDPTTDYLCSWAEYCIDEAAGKQFKILDLKGEKAISSTFHSYFEHRDPDLVFMNGHGNSECITGHDDEILLIKSKLPSSIKNKIFYLRSCECGNALAPELINHHANACIAYTRKFIFWIKNDYSTRPKEDPLARLFLQPSNDVVIDLIKGHTVQKAHEQSVHQMYKNFLHMMSSAATDEERSTAQFLWSNLKSQIVVGNIHARI